MNLFVKKFVIEENGKITVSRSFGNRLTVIEGEKSDLIQSVLRAVLGYDRLSVVCPYAVRFFTEVHAEKTFYIKGAAKEKTPVFELQIYDAGGEECAEEYYEKLQQSAEERSVNCFSDFKRQKYPHRLFRYKDSEKYYPAGDFSKLTDGFGITHCFRGFINQYIREFQPIRLHNDKDFWLHLMSDGRFVVRNSDGAEISLLSESENIVYHYLCFICLAEFWSDAEMVRNFNHINKPLLITDFLERMDRSIDVTDILRRTTQLNRQTFLFEPNPAHDDWYTENTT